MRERRNWEVRNLHRTNGKISGHGQYVVRHLHVKIVSYSLVWNALNIVFFFNLGMRNGYRNIAVCMFEDYNIVLNSASFDGSEKHFLYSLLFCFSLSFEYFLKNYFLSCKKARWFRIANFCILIPYWFFEQEINFPAGQRYRL